MGKKEQAAGELLRDTLDMLILKTLQRGAMHGYGIAERIEERRPQPKVGKRGPRGPYKPRAAKLAK